MEQLEKVERLREKTGCTYEEAKAALEASNWDMLDAIVYLENQGKMTLLGRLKCRPFTYPKMIRRTSKWMKKYARPVTTR